MEKEIIDFITKFFKNIGAEVLINLDGMIIRNIPKNFEKFYGKEGPYNFVFNKEKANNFSEYVDRNSDIIKAIYSYLEDSGQTTLLKIDFQIDPTREIINRLNLKNSKLIDLKEKKKFNFFFRFTFHTTFQYLNEKEKMINEIYVSKGKIVNGNLDNYPLLEGNKREIKIPDMKEQYFISKEELKKRIKDKTEELREKLEIKFNKEVERIENHFINEIKEYRENLEKNQLKLLSLKSEGDIEKIQRQEKILENLKSKLNLNEFEKDKQRAIALERQKHILNINNKLFNTTLIYYPVFTYDAILKNSYTKRKIEISFDPLYSKLNEIKCDVCQSNITNELNLCSNGHIVCNNCIGICSSCQKEFCANCLKTNCEICGAKICHDCSIRCSRCSRVICKTHVKKDGITGKIYCRDCLKRCERCEKLKDPLNFKISKKTGALICGACYREEMQKNVLDDVFKK